MPEAPPSQVVQMGRHLAATMRERVAERRAEATQIEADIAQVLARVREDEQFDDIRQTIMAHQGDIDRHLNAAVALADRAFRNGEFEPAAYRQAWTRFSQAVSSIVGLQTSFFYLESHVNHMF